MAEQFPSYSFSFRLPLTPDGTDRKLQYQLLPIHIAIHAVAGALDEYFGKLVELPQHYPELGTRNINTGTINRFYCKAGGAINQYDLVYFTQDATTVRAKQAQADSILTAAKGIYIGTATLANGDWAEFILSPNCIPATGLTPGLTYYLDPATPGIYTALIPVVAGEIVQDIGWAISDTILFVTPDKSVIEL